MALHWINLFDIPGADFSRASFSDATVTDGVITATQWGFWKVGAHNITIPNNPGYAFTGRYRIAILQSSYVSSGSTLTRVVVHRYDASGGWTPAPGAPMPPVGITTFEADDIPALATLTGTEATYSVSFNSPFGWLEDGDHGSFLIQYAIEFEVDYDPPPPPPFWQDFIGCKEITP